MCQIAPVAAEQYLTQVDQAVDRLLHRRDFARRRPLAVFHPAVVLEERDVVGRGLDAQHDAVLVIHLDRALAEAVLDAGALDAGGELRADLLRQQWRDLPAEEADNMLRLYVQHRLADQLLIQRAERGDGAERQVGIPPASGSSASPGRRSRRPDNRAWG